MSDDTITAKRTPVQLARDMFESENAGNRLEVVLDQGLYRHARFRKPGSSFYWFDLVTWPGNLVIRGDMGTYAFAREADMFEWFGTGPHLEADYRSQKLSAADRHGKVTEYSEDLFWAHVDQALEDVDPDRAREIREQLAADNGYGELGNRDSALRALDEYPEFSDVWEWRLNEYTNQFLYSLHCIAWGIKQWETR